MGGLKSRVANLLPSKSESLSLVGESKMLVETINGESIYNTDKNDTYNDSATAMYIAKPGRWLQSLMNLVNGKSQVFHETSRAAEQVNLSVLDCYRRSRELEKSQESP